MHVPMIRNTFQGSTVSSLSRIIQNTLARLRSANTPVIGRHHVVVTLVQPSPRSFILLEVAVGGRVLFLFPHRAGGAFTFTLYLLQCMRPGKEEQTALVRLSIFSVFIATYLTFFYCTARCSKSYSIKYI